MKLRLAISALAVAVAGAAGCAHGPAADRAAAAPGDRRPVLVELWAAWCGPCRTFESEILPDPKVQRALAGVRFVRYDIDSFAGAAAYERLTGSSSKRVPLFLGLVDDKVRWRLAGLPSDRQQLIDFIETVALLGRSESDIQAALAATPDDPTMLLRVANWYRAHHRRVEALALLTRVAALPDVPEPLRADAEWVHSCLARKGQPRDPRAPLAFVMAHPASPHAHLALEIAAILKDAPPDEVAAALRAAADAQSQDKAALNDLSYHALAAHQYDVALELVQRALRLGPDAALWDSLAEVYYYRGEAAMAVRMGERAQALAPADAQLRANLARFRRARGIPCDTVENLRYNGYFHIAEFYGDKE